MRIRSLLAISLLTACAPQEAGKNLTPAQVVEAAQQMRNTGKAADAVVLLRNELVKQPDDTTLLTQLGFALIEANRSKEALAIYDHMIALQPNDPSGYNGKAIALDHAGSHGQAQKLYRKALTLSPNSMSIENNLAMSLILDDKPTQAATQLEQLNKETGNTNKTVRRNLALAYALSGQKKKAMVLNLEDMSPEDAKENMRFYEAYVKRKHTPHAKKEEAPKAEEETAPPASPSQK